MDPMVSFGRVSELSEADRAEILALSQAVFPAAEAAAWPGRQLEWSSPEWCVRMRGPGGDLLSYVGVLIRHARYEGQPVRIGGVGGVKTHPAARRQGLAGLGMRRAVEHFHELADVEFGLLVCESRLLEYYRRLGWQEFGGRLVVRQHGAEADFTFNRVMVCGVRSHGPTEGTLDLMGPPW